MRTGVRAAFSLRWSKQARPDVFCDNNVEDDDDDINDVIADGNERLNGVRM